MLQTLNHKHQTVFPEGHTSGDRAVIQYEGCRGYSIKIFNSKGLFIIHAGYTSTPEEAERLISEIYS